MRLRDRYRTALVTGAGSGLGAAFTASLLAEGVEVWGTSRHPEMLAARAGFHPLPLDLASDASVDAAWIAAETGSGGIDLLINNAGASVFGDADQVSADAWERHTRILLLGPVRLALHAWPAMRARGGGAIVQVTSMAAELPVPYLDVYNAGKAALGAFSETLAMHAKGSGVLILDFRPGDYRTAFNDAMRPPQERLQNDRRARRVWSRLEELRQAAPPPERAAADLARALRRGRSGVVRSGPFFQIHVARWGNRLLPARCMRWLRGLYFRLDF